MNTSIDTTSYQSIITDFLERFKNNNTIEIKEYKLENFSRPGENFCSGLLKLNIHYQKEEQMFNTSVIIKDPTLSPSYNILTESTIFKKEIYIYNTVLPEMYKLWNGERLTPISYPIETSQDILILENLRETGYVTKNKFDGLDVEHCKVALQTLAQFHALSIKYKETNRNCNNSLMIKKIIPGGSKMWEHYEKVFENFLQTVSNLGEKCIAEKLGDCKQEIYESIFQSTDSNSNQFTVLLHGDFWINNLLYNYDENKRIKNMKMIDFQFSRWNSPVLDIIFLFGTSMKFEDFENYHKSLITVYLETLNENLSLLKSNSTYSESNIWNDIKRNKLYYVTVVAMELPPVLNNSDIYYKDDTFDSSNIHSSELYMSRLVKWLKFFKNEIVPLT